MRITLPARRRSAPEASAAPARRMRPPRALMLLLFVVFVATTAWALATPAWQVPDEPSHFGYAESLVEQGAKPTRGDARDAREFVKGLKEGSSFGEMSGQSTAVMNAANGYPVAADSYAKPPWSELAEKRYNDAARDASRKDGGHATGATSYPPLYYAIEGIPYRLASSGTALDRLYLMRWVSGLWALVATIGAWLLAGEVFRRRRLPQLVTAATIGLWPMVSFISGAVNPDAMLTAISLLVLWLAVKIALRGTTWRSTIGLIALVGVAVETKVSGVALAPAAAFAILYGLPQVRGRIGSRPRFLYALVAGLIAVALLMVVVGATLKIFPPQLQAVVDARPDLRRFGGYLWQFYLPRLGSMDVQNYQYPVVSERPVLNLWLGTGWGAFGWVNIWFPRWATHVFLAVVALVAGGAIWTTRRARRRRSAPNVPFAAAMLVLAIAAVGVLGGVHLQDYDNGITGQLPFAQARYLFPVIGIWGLAVGAAVLAVSERLRPMAAGGWLAFLIVLQLSAFALTATRYYA